MPISLATARQRPGLIEFVLSTGFGFCLGLSQRNERLSQLLKVRFCAADAAHRYAPLWAMSSPIR